jgi:hypothetical protein
VDELYPIGFSAEGHFAWIGYYHHTSQEWQLHVDDLVTDKPGLFLQWELGSFPDGEAPKTLRQFLRAKGQEIVGKLKDRGIQFHRTRSIGRFPLRRGKERFRVKVATGKKQHPDEGLHASAYCKHDVYLVSSLKGRKLIASLKTPEKDLVVEGYVLSPLEPRIAVVVTYATLDFEGDPDGKVTRIIGASLEERSKPAERK